MNTAAQDILTLPREGEAFVPNKVYGLDAYVKAAQRLQPGERFEIIGVAAIYIAAVDENGSPNYFRHFETVTRLHNLSEEELSSYYGLKVDLRNPDSVLATATDFLVENQKRRVVGYTLHYQGVMDRPDDVFELGVFDLNQDEVDYIGLAQGQNLVTYNDEIEVLCIDKLHIRRASGETEVISGTQYVPMKSVEGNQREAHIDLRRDYNAQIIFNTELGNIKAVRWDLNAQDNTLVGFTLRCRKTPYTRATTPEPVETDDTFELFHHFTDASRRRQGSEPFEFDREYKIHQDAISTRAVAPNEQFVVLGIAQLWVKLKSGTEELSTADFSNISPIPQGTLDDFSIEVGQPQLRIRYNSKTGSMSAIARRANVCNQNGSEAIAFTLRCRKIRS